MIIFWKDNDNNDVDDDRTADDDDSGQCVCVVCWALPVCNWKQSSKQFVFPIECFSIALDDDNDNDNDDGTDANVIVC